jgi:hypothetical protein
LADLAFNSHFARHVFDQFFTDAQTKTDPTFVLFSIFLKLVEVNKKIANIFLRDAASEVLNTELELDVDVAIRVAADLADAVQIVIILTWCELSIIAN